MFRNKLVICPVCDTKLGRKNMATDLEVFDCKECHAFVNVDQDMNIKMILWKDADKKRCGCGGCGR